MTLPDTLLFLGLFALAVWRNDQRIMMMAGVIGVVAGLSSAWNASSLSPIHSHWVGLVVALIGLYLVVRGVRPLRAEREERGDQSGSALEDRSS